MFKKHLAIMSSEVIDRIFSGTKSIETRFSQKRIAPFGTINMGDLVYLKPPGKDIKGQFIVKKVISFAGLDNKDWEFVRKEIGKQISLGSKNLDKKFFNDHQNAHFGTVIFIGEVKQFITSPLKINKKDLRGWVVLG